MKKILLLVLFCFTCASLFAQAPQLFTVKGIVIDSSFNKPLGYVTVALQDAKTLQSIKGGLTKDDGSFELKAPAGKAYQLTFASVGYKNKTIKLTQSGLEINTGKVFLNVSSKELNEVSVTAVKPVMKREVDRISYDVQADPESKALTALDMMRKVPLLSVDGSDNIQLKGSGNYKILINGKESALVAKNPSDVLRAMPATNIERIEVITTPPAKYDAEGLAGIINIITKKNVDQGYNANINARYNSIWGPGINASISVKEGKFGLSSFIGTNRRNTFTAGTDNSQVYNNGQSISQNGVNKNGGHNFYTFNELSYEIDSLNLLTASFGTYKGRENTDNDLFSSTLNTDQSVEQHYRQQATGFNGWQGYDAGLNYQLGFKKNKDQLLTLSYKFNYSPNTNYSDNLFSERENYYQSQQPNFNQFNSAGERSHTIQLDYAQPFKKVTMEAGAKAILRNDFSNFIRSDLDSATNVYNLNPAYTDDFNYQQDVYSLYNSYQLKLKKWSAKAGVRLEHTDINADFTSVNTKVNQKYNNLIPSVSIQRSFKTSSINFGFTQRIQRPGIYQLNPFVDNTNPQFVSTGNPNLRPELNNTFELNYSNFAKNAFNLGLSYAFSNNSIQNVTNLTVKDGPNNTLDTVTTTTYQNLGSNRTLGLNFNTNLNFAKQLSISFNGQIQNVWLRGTYNGEFYKNSGITGSGFGSFGYKFGTGYRAGIDAGFFSGQVTLQGKSSSFVYNGYSITKEFLNKKATISFVINNPETKYHDNTSTTTTPQFYQSTLSQSPYRSFNVRLNYKFGRLNGDIKRNRRGIDNDDTKGGGKSSGGN